MTINHVSLSLRKTVLRRVFHALIDQFRALIKPNKHAIPPVVMSSNHRLHVLVENV